jgi:hypothetical protein
MGLIYGFIVLLSVSFEELSNTVFGSSFAFSAPYWAFLYA